MNFNKHFNLEGRHAFLSPSQYHWIRYSDEKIDLRFLNRLKTQRGNDEHAVAAELIRLGIKLPASRKTLNMYVNDAIGYRMTPEQPLYYSENCFGTADSIVFRKMLLRIFDLKTGDNKTSVDQLLVYAAIFCLEYGFKPFEIDYDLRIYQYDEIAKFVTDPSDVAQIMDRIITADKRINAIKEEVSS